MQDNNFLTTNPLDGSQSAYYFCVDNLLLNLRLCNPLDQYFGRITLPAPGSRLLQLFLLIYSGIRKVSLE